MNGASGNASATAAFANNPGTQAAINQATQTVDRNRAAQGMLASGNTDTDLTNYATGLVDQNYNNYVNGLQNYLGTSNNTATSAAGGIAGVNTGLGNQLNANQGSLANLDWNAATGTGNANANASLAGLTASGNLVNGLMSFL